MWPELRRTIPPETYEKFARYVGVKVVHAATWAELRHAFETFIAQRVTLGVMAKPTYDRYKVSTSAFSQFLGEKGVVELAEVTKPMVEEFKIWKLDKSAKRKEFRGGAGLSLEAAILHRVFAYAVEHEMLARNPVKMEGRPGERPARGAQPFTGEELAALRANVDVDRLAFLLLRWTGLRGSDAVAITWREVDLTKRELTRVTQKRRKTVVVPLHTELHAALVAERDRRKPRPDQTVLINPITGKRMNRPRLYDRIKALGRKAGIVDAHPHRFRDTLAVDMLARGATPYDVAKVLGDTIETVERHYAPFVTALRERVRSLLESPGGLERL